MTMASLNVFCQKNANRNTALICCPDIVLPSEYLPLIFGEDHAYENAEQATDILGLIMRHWNDIATGLLQAMNKNDMHLPIILEDKDGVAHGNDWAQGFMRGVQLRSPSWYELINSEEFGGAILPMMALAHEHDPDPIMRPGEITPEKRKEALALMVRGTAFIYRYFEPQRRSPVQHKPLRKDEKKIGRNDPCLCGSGRKYKHCCAANGVFH